MFIVITGASGFLGRNLLNKLKETQHNVYALTSRPDEIKREMSNINKIIFIHRNRYADIPWEKIDVLINCAFPRNTDGIMMAEGLKYIQNILLFAVEQGVKSVINISSQSVYSQKRKEAATEETPLDLETKYAVGKYATELITNSICRRIRHTNIRLASLIGPEFEQRLVNKLVRQAMDGDDLNIVGVEQYFGFMDVDDASNAILKVAEDDSEWDENYNLGIEGVYSIVELAQNIKEIVNNKISVVVENSDTYINSNINAKLFYTHFGFKPKMRINQSLYRIAKYIKEQDRKPHESYMSIYK